MLKTGRKCNWEEIKVGEVFAWNGCWTIMFKVSKYTAISIASDETDCWDFCPIWHTWDRWWFIRQAYKLPISVQRLWKEE